MKMCQAQSNSYHSEGKKKYMQIYECLHNYLAYSDKKDKVLHHANSNI